MKRMMPIWIPALLYGLVVMNAGAGEPVTGGMAPASPVISVVQKGADDTILVAQSILLRRPREYVPSPMREPNEAKMRAWLFVKLREYICLDDAAAKRFEPIFTEYSVKRRALEKRQHSVMRQIDRGMSGNALPDKQLQTLIKQYQEIERSILSEREHYYKKAGKVLNARQMGRLVISEDKMKEDFFKRVRKERGVLNTGQQEDSPPPPPDR